MADNQNWRIAGEVIGAVMGKFTKGIVFGFGFAVGLAFAHWCGIWPTIG